MMNLQNRPFLLLKAHIMYQSVVIILWKSASEVFLLMTVERVSFTSSCSKGSKEVRKGVLDENQTGLAK
jgi:hypothetical protein